MKLRGLPGISALLFILCFKGSRLFGMKLKNPHAAAEDINWKKISTEQKGQDKS